MVGEGCQLGLELFVLKVHPVGDLRGHLDHWKDLRVVVLVPGFAVLGSEVQ